MGIWAIIVGFTSILSQSTAAVNTNIIREVAEADDENFRNKASILIVNGLVIYLVFFILLSAFVIGSFIILFKENFFEYLSLIGIILSSIFINLLATIFSSVLDARRLNFIKNSFLAIANVLFISLCFFTISSWGLKGVAIAQLIQASLLLLFVLFYILYKMQLRFSLKSLSKQQVLLFFRDSWRLQTISLLVLCYEPITKYFLSKYGLTYVAKYEIANKIIAQVRNIFAIANQTLLSYFVNKLTQGKQIFIDYYVKISSKNTNLAFISNGLLLIITPLISLFFLKNIDWNFILIFTILLISNLVNIVSITPYFNFFAQKKYNVPFISHSIIAVLNIGLSLLLGFLFNGIGVVIAWSASLLIGSIYIIYLFNKKELKNNSIKSFKDKFTLTFSLLAASAAVLYALYMFAIPIQHYSIIIGIFIILFLYQAFKLSQINE